jgi:hypothetical protein
MIICISSVENFLSGDIVYFSIGTFLLLSVLYILNSKLYFMDQSQKRKNSRVHACHEMMRSLLFLKLVSASYDKGYNNESQG